MEPSASFSKDFKHKFAASSCEIKYLFMLPGMPKISLSIVFWKIDFSMLPFEKLTLANLTEDTNLFLCFFF